MFKQLLISTAISTALISTPLLAAGTSMGSDNPQTTGQQMSGPNDAGGQASTDAGDQAGTSAQDMDFDELDVNKDGNLDEDELNRYGATAAGGTDTEGGKDQSERMLKMYDHDDDGSISKKEMEAGSRTKDKMDN